MRSDLSARVAAPVAIAAPHTAAVAAAERAIAAGGNALDAALAAAAMLSVVYPHQCSLGGDLIALVRTPAGETLSIVSAGAAPADILSIARNWTTMPRQGAHTVTVPGIVAGWTAIAELGARLPLRAALLDAAETADRGTPVSAGLERAIDSRVEQIRADAGLAEVFAPGGSMLREGDSLRQPALAATLRRLADDPRDIYDGVTAELLVEALTRAGGTHRIDDFRAHAAEVGSPVEATIAGARWFAAPPPSVGALLLGVAAAAEDASENDPARDPGNLLLDASLLGVRSRAAHLGDPRTGPASAAALLALAGAESAMAGESPAHGDTVAITAADAEGWGVTIVQSVYMTFGAGMLDPATGIVLHNRGAAFSLDLASPARLLPGARPPHTLCPVIIEDDDVLVVAGCQGGRAQPWILAQLIPQLRDPAVALGDTLARPRWVIGDVDLGHAELTFVAEPGADDELVAYAESIPLPVARFAGPDDSAGHVQVVRRTSHDGFTTLDAASDPRADGAAVVVPN
ncbi:gamma-glutamyltransferase [Microbacterium rhizomatis]|uniref:Tyramine oxidase n=1 Tax=Microbacterium rhizomatis TaxID=1631477 RepID=A0A5J5J0K8_9MICO|nr:gamma-glutamyltransferase [Microbacterium rhizomatis]KAA9108066.1 tyramine oxidase [Microbacterium rhizomatis]